MEFILLKRQEKRSKMEKLLKVKAEKKAKNPVFKKQDSYKKKRLSTSWRKPRGWDSKLRKRMQRQAIVEPGYGTPAVLRGKSSAGLQIIVIATEMEMRYLPKSTRQ